MAGSFTPLARVEFTPSFCGSYFQHWSSFCRRILSNLGISQLPARQYSNPSFTHRIPRTYAPVDAARNLLVHGSGLAVLWRVQPIHLGHQFPNVFRVDRVAEFSGTR